MKAGYLAIEAPPQGIGGTGVIKMLSWDELPQSDKDESAVGAGFPENVRYVARFNDILAATMHFHNGLRKNLEDINTHVYRTELTHAIAVIEAESDLRHERIWIDPTISQGDLEAIKQDAEKIRTKKNKINRVIKIVGYLAIGLLIFNAIASML